MWELRRSRKNRKRGEHGIAMILTLVILSSLLLGSVGLMVTRVANLRGGREILRGKLAFYCAEAGLHAGRDFFRAHASQWDNYLQQNFVYQEQAAQSAGASPLHTAGLSFNVAIRDNIDEFPPLANDPTKDIDQTVILESTCADPALQTPITLRSYLSILDSSGTHQSLGPVVFDKSFHSDPQGPCFTGNFPVDGSGGLQGGSSSFNPAGILSVGVDLRDDELKLQVTPTTFPFIWLTNSGEGTISKLSTETGVELGRYRTAPDDQNPSRTAVDLDGNVWIGNRGENTLTKIGLLEAGNCVDRNGDGLISTSAGGSDVKAWVAGWDATWGNVTGALDECILLHVELSHASADTPCDIRAVAVDANNYVYAGGESCGHGFFKIRGSDGAIVAAMNTSGQHYGALVDRQGSIWVASDCSGYVQKISNDLTSHQVITVPVSVYGLALDSHDHLWISSWSGGHFMRMNLDGTGQVVFPQASSNAQGLAVTANNEVILAASMYNPKVQRYDHDGTLLSQYTVAGGPTGVAVDHAGKIWSSNYTDASASRVDLATGAVDTFPIGTYPYNYSDNTGYIIRNYTAHIGTWMVRHDGGGHCHHWKSITWDIHSLPAGTSITVRARSATNTQQLGGAPWRAINNGEQIPADAGGLPGRMIEVQVTLVSSATGASPVIDKITLTPWN